MDGPIRVVLPPTVAIGVEAVADEFDEEGGEEGWEIVRERGEVGGENDRRGAIEPEEFLCKVMGVVVTQGSSVLFGTTVVVRDDQSIDETLLNEFTIYFG